MTIEFPSLSANEDFAEKTVAAFAMQLDPTQEELADIRTAVSEAVNNAIVHAYPDRVGKISLKCRILNNDILDIVIKDKGRGIEDVERAARPMYTTGGANHSGMGFTVMKSFMTSCEVKSTFGKGTTVHMKRKIVPRLWYSNNM